MLSARVIYDGETRGEAARPALEGRLGKLWFVRLMEYYVAIQNI